MSDQEMQHDDDRQHELYLGDPRRAAAERLETMIRQPFVRSAPS